MISIKNLFNNHGYSKIAIKALAWTSVLKLSMRVITFARIAVLARILSPAQFGIFGIATLVLSLIEILTETGINVFLIQQNESIKRYLNTAWIVSIIRGIIIAVLIVLFTPFIASFFNSPNAKVILALTAAIPLIRGFINPAVVKFQKELSFDKEFYFRFSIFLVEAVVVLAFAFVTRSEISLVMGLIVSSVLEVIMSFVFISPKPELQFNLNIFKQIISRGKWVTSTGISNYLFQNADDIVVGKLLGAPYLGLYQMAYKISILPITEISDVIAKVAFPIFVKISSDQKRLRQAFMKTFLLVSALSLVLGALSILFTREIVLFLLGDKWLDMVPFLKILIVFGVIRAITGSPAMLFLAVKKQEYASHFTLASFVILMIVIFPLINSSGLVGASSAALIASIAVIPLTAYYTYKVLFYSKK